MTCYLRLHEVAVAVHHDGGDETDWAEVGRRWHHASGVDDRDDALDAMPVSLVEVDDLPTAPLDSYAGLIVSGRVDQRLLAGMAGRIKALVDSGGVVVFSGQLTHDWLPGTSLFERTGGDESSGPPVLSEHPIFDGVAADDLGSAFLYRNGWHRPPVEAKVIARRGDGTPGAYVHRIPGHGTVLLHGGANLLANVTTTGSAARIVPQLIEWVVAQAGR
ncbi:MAG: hypothetical protein M3471_01435 [Actinomycetota bacterium]|nr:hypothetical protein [Actinomycetota bacterium]